MLEFILSFFKKFIFKVLNKKSLKLVYSSVNKTIVLQIILIYIPYTRKRFKADFYLKINRFFD